MSSTTPSLFGGTSSANLASQTSALLSSLRSLASASPSASASGSTNFTQPIAGSDLTSPIVLSQTPIFVCVPASYNISGGNPPYQDVFLINSGAVNATILKTLPPEQAGGTFSWGVDVQPGTSVTFAVKDSLNQTGYSQPVVVQTSDNTSCLPSTKKNIGAIVGGTIGGVAGVAALALFLWFFAIKPSRQKRRPKDPYEEPGEEMSASLTAKPTLSGPGTFNLGSLDFRPESIEQLQQARAAGLPSYDTSQGARLATTNAQT